MDKAQHRPATARHAEGAGQSGPCPATRREADVLQGSVDTRAVATTTWGKGRKALGKNPLCTGSGPAEEATDPHTQADRRSTQR
jgi:hypothetical protein